MQPKFAMHDTSVEEMRQQEHRTKVKMQISARKAITVQLGLESRRNARQEHSAIKQVRYPVGM